MTRLSEGFETPANGVAIDNTNSIFSSTGGTTPGVADTGLFLLGSKSMKQVYSSSFGYQQYLWGSNQVNQYYRGYHYISSLPSSGQSVYLSFLSGGTQRAQITIATNGKFNMRSPAVLQASSSAAYNGKWIRLEWDVTGSTQVLRIFSGANLYGSTPDETVSGAVSVGTGFDRIRIGSTAVDTYTAYVDGVEIDSAATPGPATAPGPTDAAYYWDGSALVACDVYWWNGTTMVQCDPYWWNGTTLV
jgi:hypothetical protein